MEAVFADTGFFLALINSRDAYHRQAAVLNATLEAPLVTTEWVLLELANALSASRSRLRFGQVLDSLRVAPNVEIVAADTAMFDRGCRHYFDRRTRNGPSLTVSLSSSCANAAFQTR